MTPITFKGGDWYVIQNMPEKPELCEIPKCNPRVSTNSPAHEQTCDCEKKENRYKWAIKDAPTIKIANPEILSPTNGRSRDGETEWINIHFNGKTVGLSEGEVYWWPGTYKETRRLCCDEYHSHTKTSCYIYEAVLTVEPEQKEEKFDPFLVCGPPARKKRKKSLERQGSEIIEQLRVTNEEQETQEERIKKCADEYIDAEMEAFVKSDPIVTKSKRLVMKESFEAGAKSENKYILDKAIEMVSKYCEPSHLVISELNKLKTP